MRKNTPNQRGNQMIIEVIYKYIHIIFGNDLPLKY